MFKKLNLFIVVLLVSQMAFAFGVPKMPGSSDAESKSSSGANVDQMQANLIISYQNALVLEMEAKSLFFEAVGNKEQAAIHSKQGEALKSDGLKSTDDLKKAIQQSEGSSALANAELEKSSEFSEESKKIFAKGLAKYAGSLIITKDLLPQLKDFGSAASTEIKSAGMTGAASVKDRLGVGMYMASKLPNHYKSTLTTAKKMSEFGKKIGIVSSNDAAAQMPD